MAKHVTKDSKAIICLLLAFLCAGAIIALFVTGGIFFSAEHPKVLNYANSMCQVDSIFYKTYTCTSRYYTYSCYGPIWRVHHGEYINISAVVEIEKRYRSPTDALVKANEYQIRSSYSCWYDTRDSSVAQWDKPSTTIAVILLSCGGLSVLLTILFFFITIKLVKEEMLQIQPDNMSVYSYPNDFIRT